MVDELRKMNADIDLISNKAIITGKSDICGAEVVAPDLRGGASLILAGLGAEGVTTVSGLDIINRGYDRIDEKLRSLGAVVRKG